LALAVLIGRGRPTTGSNLRVTGPGEGFIGGNGRIEATEVDVSTKMAGRVHDIIVNEGSFVKAGEPLAYMQIDVLRAQLAEAQAKLMQAGNNVSTARAQVAAKGHFHVEEAALTGESLPVEKGIEAVAADAPLGDRYCMAFMGTVALTGQAHGIAVAIFIQSTCAGVRGRAIPAKSAAMTIKASPPLVGSMKRMNFLILS